MLERVKLMLGGIVFKIWTFIAFVTKTQIEDEKVRFCPF